jgi:hypothetical protein
MMKLRVAKLAAFKRNPDPVIQFSRERDLLMFNLTCTQKLRCR